MATPWTTVRLTDACTAPRTGYLLLPKGSPMPPAHVKIRSRPGAKIRILRAGLRPDHGEAAWADPEIVAAAAAAAAAAVAGVAAAAAVADGGPQLQYQPAGLLAVLRYSSKALLQALIAVLTLASAALTAVAGFTQSTGGTVAVWIAVVALVVAVVLAVVSFLRDWRGAAD